MKQIKFLKKVETCTCPMCHVQQTIFIYYFNEAGDKVPFPTEGVIPQGAMPGFICVKCDVPVRGNLFYATMGLTIGDLPIIQA